MRAFFLVLLRPNIFDIDLAHLCYQVHMSFIHFCCCVHISCGYSSIPIGNASCDIVVHRCSPFCVHSIYVAVQHHRCQPSPASIPSKSSIFQVFLGIKQGTFSLTSIYLQYFLNPVMSISSPKNLDYFGVQQS